MAMVSTLYEDGGELGWMVKFDSLAVGDQNCGAGRC